MNPWYVVLGLLLIGVTFADALWTTLWVDGHSAPVTGRLTSLVSRVTTRLAGRRQRLLSITGPLVLVMTVMHWALLLWAGWVALFSAERGSLLHSHRQTPADLPERIYFTGYSIFTLGNGDYSPSGRFWQVATAAASLSGLVLVTLAVTYLLSVLESVVNKRSFASQVMALARTPEDFVLHSWNGRGFPGLELQVMSLTEQLNRVTEQYQAYPMLHYYHAAGPAQSVPLALAVFEDALTLLAHGVGDEHRPGPAAVHCARESVGEFLRTIRNVYVSRARDTPPAPRLDRLRAAGIPLVSDAEFAAALGDRAEQRRLLLAFVESERRDYPRAR